MSRPPTFKELADWIDGRLDDETAAAVASRAASHDSEVGGALTWLREFRAAAALMPLQSPSPQVTEAARAAFRQLRMPWGAGQAGGIGEDDLSIEFDSRLAPVAGVRSTMQTRSFHLGLSAPGLVVDLDATDMGGAGTEFSGSIVCRPDADRGTEESVIGVVFLHEGEDRSIAPVDRTGAFGTTLHGEVDQLCVVTSDRRLWLSLDRPRWEN